MEIKTILITGASSGVGYEAALQLSQKGHQVIALARNTSLLEKLKTASEGKIIICTHDLATLNFDDVLKTLTNYNITHLDV